MCDRFSSVRTASGSISILPVTASREIYADSVSRSDISPSMSFPSALECSGLVSSVCAF